MIYVLIVLTYVSGYASGYGVAMQEFSDKAACSNAVESIKSRVKMDAWCVPKSSEVGK